MYYQVYSTRYVLQAASRAERRSSSAASSSLKKHTKIVNRDEGKAMAIEDLKKEKNDQLKNELLKKAKKNKQSSSTSSQVGFYHLLIKSSSFY